MIREAVVLFGIQDFQECSSYKDTSLVTIAYGGWQPIYLDHHNMLNVQAYPPHLFLEMD